MRTVILKPDEELGGYNVRVPSLRGCNTQGNTVEEALANAREAIELYLETLQELGREIPPEDDGQIVLEGIGTLVTQL